MTFVDIIERLPAHIVHRSSDFPGAPLRHVIASDLMSDVLVCDYEDAVMVTSLASEQSVRTADIVGARGIILVNDYGFFSSPGVRAAVDEFFAVRPEHPIYLPSGQCLIIKR